MTATVNEAMIATDRILEGVAKTLEEIVLPALPPGYARGQLYAVLEVVGSLQGQLLLGGPMLESEAAMIDTLLAEAAQSVAGDLGERCGAYATRASSTLAERLRDGRSLVCELIAGGHGDGGALGSAIDSYLANDSILKAMALRPGRLAEISQG